MKTEFSRAIEEIAKKDKKVFFLTGDLGYNAFENLIANVPQRFINAGVAEQNMVSVAAGMARMGLKPWVYSIASFLTLKTLEQTRNDVCHLHLPVKLVGNGGGYGYGIMGETHHLLEDFAIFSSLPGMKIYAPAFVEDVERIVMKMHLENTPSYLRLNLAPKTFIKLPPYAGLRHLSKGKSIVIVSIGTLIHNTMEAISLLGKKYTADLWCVTELPVTFSKDFFSSLKKIKKIVIVEEHTLPGGIGEKIFSELMRQKIFVDTIHIYAKGYPSKRYGSHAFHLRESELDPKGIYQNMSALL